MSATHTQIIDECVKNGLSIIEPVKGRDGLLGISIVTGDRYFFVPQRDTDEWRALQVGLLSSSIKIGVWDLRRILDWPLADERIIYDVKSLYGGDLALPALARQISQRTSASIYPRYLYFDQKVVAHARAMKTAKISMPTSFAIPPGLLADWLRERSAVIFDLFQRSFRERSDDAAEYERRWSFIRRLRETELTGVHVDIDFVENALNGDSEPATGRALRSLQGLYRDGFVTSLINPIGSKTGRVRHEGGFNTLGIPHGPARTAINSRWPGGKIVGFDFNAIDYRCIVKAVGGEVAALYEGSRDFHERTASFIFKKIAPGTRDKVKYLSYIYIYGGSEETLAQKTGWNLEEIKKALALLDKRIQPIKEFRSKLWMSVQETGFIDVPGGRRIYVPSEDRDNEGKIIGLYAQSYSSYVFEQAFVRVHRHLESAKSRIIFSVHDELVIDCHPDEVALMDELIPLLERDGNVVKKKVGDNYGFE